MADIAPEDRMVIESPEQVEVLLELAGLGSRFAAALIDTVCLGALMVLAGLLLWGMSALVARSGGSGALASLGGLGLALAIALGFGVFLTYYIVCEMRLNGQTPGKRVVGIRVVRDGGQPVRLLDSALRNLIRFFEATAGAYTLTFISLLVTARRKRLGDLAAGTIVVKATPPQTPVLLTMDLSTTGLPPEWCTAIEENVGEVSQEEYEFIGRLVERASRLPYPMVTRMAVDTAWPLMRRMGISVTPEQMVSPTLYYRFLQGVALAYARRSSRAQGAGAPER